MQKKAVSIDLLRGFVTLIKHASEFIEKQAEKEEKVASQIPAVVEGMIDRGLVDPIERNEITASLMDHEKCLKAVKIASKHATIEKLGSAVSLTPTADTTPGVSPVRESDRRFEEAMLGS